MGVLADSKMQAEQSSEAEVFETSDVDEEEVVKKQPESEVAQGDDRVETTSVAPEDAFEKFSGKTYAVLPSGLSDSLSRSGLYDPSHLSILGRVGGVETPQQRLMRLKHEVKELSLEMGASDGASDPSESFPSDVLSEVSALTQQLEALQTPSLSPDQILAQQIQAKLGEKLVSTMNSSAEASSGSASGVYEHMSVLLKQKKSAAPSSDQEEQIQRMFDTMQRWEGAAKELPGVVARLRSLQSLHVEGASMVEAMQSMEKQHSDMTTKLGTEMSQLGAVEATLKENVDTITANMTSLEERMAAVSK